MTLSMLAPLIALAIADAAGVDQRPSPSPSVSVSPSPSPSRSSTPGGARGAQSANPAPSDETVAVARGARLDVNNFAGEILVRTWDRDAVRVESQSSRDRVSVQATEQVVRVRVSSRMGVQRSVDLIVTAPRWMSMNLNGTYTDMVIEGAQGDVTAETVKGDMRLKGGSGFVSLKSIEGVITAEGSKGRLQLSSVNEGIHVSDSSGEINAETVNGELTFERIDASTVDVGTVNGDVNYEGSFKNDGRYRFATHNGDVILTGPDTVNATISVRAYSGDFQSLYPGSKVENAGPAGSDRRERRGHRLSITLGNGSGRVEVESFGGDIVLRPKSAATKARDRNR